MVHTSPVKLLTFYYRVSCVMGFPGGSAVENPPLMQEIWVQSLSGKDPLEKEIATHSSILAWRIPLTEELSVLQSMGL